MGTNYKETKNQIIKQYGSVLQYALNQPEVGIVLKDYGYTDSFLNEGWILFQQTNDVFNNITTNSNVNNEAFNNFNEAKNTLFKTYSSHKEIAKKIFKEDDNTLSILKIDKDLPIDYANWIAGIKFFYSNAIGSNAIESKLINYKILQQSLYDAVALIAEVESLRDLYLNENKKGNHSKEVKKMVFNRFNNWMNNFFIVAKTAFKNKPEILNYLVLNKLDKVK